MKKLTMAVGIVVMLMAGFGSASAEMVDIGLGRMEQSEFVALKAMVQDGQTGNVPVISTPLARPERYGMVEMTRTEIESLRNIMAGHSVSVAAKPAVTSTQMVNIGTGEMPLDEFTALKKMVNKENCFILNHLAAAQP